MDLIKLTATKLTDRLANGVGSWDKALMHVLGGLGWKWDFITGLRMVCNLKLISGIGMS